MRARALYGMQATFGGILLLSGMAKLVGIEIMVREFDLIGLGQWFRVAAGMVEVSGGLLLFAPRLGVCGALLVCCLSVGAAGATLARAVLVPSHPLPSSAPYFSVAKTSQA